MGCDIHAHFEIKVGGEWLHYSEPNISRWYSLFGKIAGVRDHSQELISYPKGIPDDVSKVTQLHLDRWNSDGHTHTWLNAQEIATLVKWVEDNAEGDWKFRWEHEQLGYLFGNEWGTFLEYRDDYPDFIEDIRLICWFDN